MKELRFDGQVAVITGAGRENGLGFAYAKLLGERGAKIVVNAFTTAEEGVAKLRKLGIDAIAVNADISKMEEAKAVIDAAINTYGRLDIVVNNAGMSRAVSIEDENEELFDRIMKVNAYGTRNICRAALPIMMQQKYGRVVNTTSSAGMYGMGACHAYSASKGAVYGMTRSMAIACEPYGIMINAIAPSAATDMSLNDAGLDEESKGLMLQLMSSSVVAPSLAVLVHESCNVTGRVFESAAGRTGEIFVGTTIGIFSPENSPEFIAENWEEMTNREGYVTLKNGLEAGNIIGLAVEKASK